VRASESSSCRADAMYRLHFSASDLARIRLVASYGPYAEALFSLGALADGRRDAAVFGGWRQRVRSAQTAGRPRSID
jgi:hypothetical protein